METDQRYCPNCGTPVVTKRFEGRDRQFCPDCQQILYRNPKPCAGVVVVDGERILLIQRTEPPAVGAWSLPAGYLEADEPPEQAAVRELREETGLQTVPEALTLVSTAFIEHPTGQHVLVIVYAAPRRAVNGELRAGSDAAAVRFWRLQDLVVSQTEQLEPGYLETFRQAQELVTEC